MELNSGFNLDKKELLMKYWPIYSEGYGIKDGDTAVYLKKVELDPEVMWKEAIESWYFGTGAKRIVDAIRSYRKNSYYSSFLYYEGYGNNLDKLDEDRSLIEKKFMEHVIESIGVVLNKSDDTIDGLSKSELLMLYWFDYSGDVAVDNRINNGYLNLIKAHPDLMWKEAITSWLSGKDASNIVRIIKNTTYWSMVLYPIRANIDCFESKTLEVMEPLFKIHVFDKVWQNIASFKENGITHVLGRPFKMFGTPGEVLDEDDIGKLPKINKELLLSVYFDIYSRNCDVTLDDFSSYLKLVNLIPDLMWREALLAAHQDRNAQDIINAMRDEKKALVEYLMQCDLELANLDKTGINELKFNMAMQNIVLKKIWDAKIRSSKSVKRKYFSDAVEIIESKRPERIRNLDVVLKCHDIASEVSLDDEISLKNNFWLCRKNLLKLYWSTYSKGLDVRLDDTARYLSCVETNSSKIWDEALVSFFRKGNAANIIFAMREKKDEAILGNYLEQCKACASRLRSDGDIEERFTEHIIDTCVSPIVCAMNRIEQYSQKYGKTYKYTNTRRGNVSVCDG